jgi:hypothetical protein
MKILLRLFWALALPLAFFLAVVRFDSVFSFVLNLLLLGGPQLVWTLICLAPVPRSVYYGGIVCCQGLLLYCIWCYFFRIVGHDPYNEGFPFLIGFFYLPFSPVAIIVGAVLGYSAGRLFQPRQ